MGMGGTAAARLVARARRPAAGTSVAPIRHVQASEQPGGAESSADPVADTAAPARIGDAGERFSPSMSIDPTAPSTPSPVAAPRRPASSPDLIEAAPKPESPLRRLEPRSELVPEPVDRPSASFGPEHPIRSSAVLEGSHVERANLVGAVAVPRPGPPPIATLGSNVPVATTSPMARRLEAAAARQGGAPIPRVVDPSSDSIELAERLAQPAVRPESAVHPPLESDAEPSLNSRFGRLLRRRRR
jgi:hypothetical protein